MTYTKVIYPPSVEEKLVVLCDCVKSIEIDKKIQKDLDKLDKGMMIDI